MVELGMPLLKVNFFAYQLCPFSETLFIKTSDVKHMVVDTTFKESFLIFRGYLGSQERKSWSKGRMREGCRDNIERVKVKLSYSVVCSDTCLLYS